MHAVFMPYGKKECVDMLLRDIGAQKLQLRAWKKDAEGKETDVIAPWIDCQLRILPLGVYEFIFPKEYMPQVLTALWFGRHEEGTYNLNKELRVLGLKIKPLDYVKRFLRIEDPPKFDTKEGIIWYEKDVGIIPIGIRYDGEIQEANGYWHEAI
jgi:hypothetical protein